ncbi:MAG TPA: hypothetical protein VN462_04325 [Negativicutes bacterium]|nr:hypothetical protein [Negativicutes bacterium]
MDELIVGVMMGCKSLVYIKILQIDRTDNRFWRFHDYLSDS